MTIHLPAELEQYVRDQVLAGRFRTEEDVIPDALERHRQAQQQPGVAPVTPDPVLGSMRDDADLLDEIVEHAMKNRRAQPWRLSAIE
jgi:Arc/MetJ-type ribon-helix-helix transcriptional regulator